VFISLLKMIESQSYGFVPSQPTREEHSEQGSVALSFQTLTIGCWPKRLTLLCR
jgi:hypothetical protein